MPRGAGGLGGPGGGGGAMGVGGPGIAVSRGGGGGPCDDTVLTGVGGLGVGAGGGIDTTGSVERGGPIGDSLDACWIGGPSNGAGGVGCSTMLRGWGWFEIGVWPTGKDCS